MLPIQQVAATSRGHITQVSAYDASLLCGQQTFQFHSSKFMPGVQKEQSDLSCYLKVGDQVVFIPSLQNCIWPQAESVYLPCVLPKVCRCSYLQSLNGIADIVCGVVDSVNEHGGTILSPRFGHCHYARDSFMPWYHLPLETSLEYFLKIGMRVMFRCVPTNGINNCRDLAECNSSIRDLFDTLLNGAKISTPHPPITESLRLGPPESCSSPLTAVDRYLASAAFDFSLLPSKRGSTSESNISMPLKYLSAKARTRSAGVLRAVLLPQQDCANHDVTNLVTSMRHHSGEDLRQATQHSHELIARTHSLKLQVPASKSLDSVRQQNVGTGYQEERDAIGFITTVYHHCAYVFAGYDYKTGRPGPGLCYLTKGSIIEKSPEVGNCASLRNALTPFQVVRFTAVYRKERQWMNSPWLISSILPVENEYLFWDKLILCSCTVICNATQHRVYAESEQYKRIVVEHSAYKDPRANMCALFPKGSTLLIVMVRCDRSTMDWKALRIVDEHFKSIEEIRRFYLSAKEK